jgi:hypothetical protein
MGTAPVPAAQFYILRRSGVIREDDLVGCLGLDRNFALRHRPVALPHFPVAKRREERLKRRQEGAAARALPDRLDRAAQRASQRAERLKAFNDAFRPFYASLNEEQKALSYIVLRSVRGGRGFHDRWDRAAQQK